MPDRKGSKLFFLDGDERVALRILLAMLGPVMLLITISRLAHEKWNCRAGGLSYGYSG